MPIVAWAALLIVATGVAGGGFLVVVAACLAGAVFAAVHHAEVVAHRIGEPYGTLVLAIAVTVIEVALIVSVMLSMGDAKAALARDTVFAAIMIVCNGIVGLCLLAGRPPSPRAGLPPPGRERRARRAGGAVGTGPGAAAITRSPCRGLSGRRRSSRSRGSRRSFSYGAFVFIQTVRHRDYFLAADGRGRLAAHPRRRRAQMWTSAALLLVCLVAVVGLAKSLSPSIEAARRAMGRPRECRRDHHRGARPAARRDRRGAGGSREQAADEPQPRARLRARKHRPHDSRRRRDLHRGRASAGSRTGGQGDWSCWR